ncbi:MAG: SH3 domain-containing protein [Firmicutes bacterium]|nr:SH3 domain-containing protein [Bacillota bacterium]
MNKKRILSILIAAMLIVCMAVTPVMAAVAYLPGVTSAMSKASYWSKDQTVLMTNSEIQALNAKTIATSGTGMYDLKNQKDVVDGVALNASLLKSSQADADYYIGWTYLGTDKKSTQADFDPMIKNTQNPNAQKEQKTKYGVAVARTELRSFPSETPIWDDPKDLDFDYLYLATVRVNEPLVITSVSADGKYYLAKSVCCSGWVPAEAVAICADKTEWLAAWDIAPENSLVVYADKTYTEKSVYAPSTSNLMLTMGTVLEIADHSNPNVLIDNRATYNNHVVYVPVRNADGSYSKKLTLISESKKVSEGYLPMTKANISSVAFNALGNTYGWGGSMLSDDCSGYVRNIYKCFGLELARNTTWQSAMPMTKVDMTNMCREEREKFLDALPLGSILFFSGHEMMYLGKENGNYYVISSISSIMQPESSSTRQRVRSIVLNTLDIKRANGNTWRDSLTVALVPYWSTVSSTTGNLPATSWYNEGVAFVMKKGLMQGDENKNFKPNSNITWAEFLQIVYNMEGKPAVEVPEAEAANWYAKAVTWAESQGIVHEADSDYQPNTPMTRQELAATIYLYCQYKGYDVSAGDSVDIKSYKDVAKIADYAKPAVAYAAGSGLMTGKTANTFNPADKTTRAEIATILQRFYSMN